MIKLKDSILTGYQTTTNSGLGFNPTSITATITTEMPLKKNKTSTTDEKEEVLEKSKNIVLDLIDSQIKDSIQKHSIAKQSNDNDNTKKITQGNPIGEPFNDRLANKTIETIEETITSSKLNEEELLEKSKNLIIELIDSEIKKLKKNEENSIIIDKINEVATVDISFNNFKNERLLSIHKIEEELQKLYKLELEN